MPDYKKPDYWQLKARKEGYPARSIYKLKEMDEKFGLLQFAPRGGGGSGKTAAPFKILDLGAAPGSWSLYALRKLTHTKASNFFLCSVDIAPLSRQYDQGLFEGEHFRFIQGDITDSAIRDTIVSYGPYHLIISDAAPATTGNRAVDAARSLELAEAVTAYAEIVLKTGGNLAIKVFQGGDTADLLKRIRTLFKTAKSFKPQSCRSESFETYYIGLGKIAQTNPLANLDLHPACP